ncbi:hypothetical protein EV199_2530 [Pseudobacter ginsenosidimutans]|uniref:Uncharacterized protein n=1 Tax=Pseudobacter ginsenosidimutans TaxID=661488 RepID=A0A4Q7N6C7_9BACT|nr:hypothetical protein EV199_2530 [Pseudobacter ginsenosidimutans]
MMNLIVQIVFSGKHWHHCLSFTVSGVAALEKSAPIIITLYRSSSFHSIHNNLNFTIVTIKPYPTQQ